MDVEVALERVVVLCPGERGSRGPKDWYTVVDDRDAVACFKHEEDANRFRWDYVYQLLSKEES